MAETPSNIPEFSVSEISGAVKRTLETTFGRIRVRGELTEVKRYPSGHIYFSLKDEGGKLSGVVWKSSVSRLGMQPENGVEVICQGKISAYGDRSSYQLIVERMDYAGAGALLAKIEALRVRLMAEGLFDPARKRPLPMLPVVIGVVTSPQGAVIQDIRTTILRRFPRSLLLWPVAVQGEGSAAQIAAAIRGFSALPAGGPIPRPDVVIVARGGGSLEDLMAFNDEDVVRAAAASTIPLISAVGHETDTTLIDFASDRRAPTPTAAAEIAIPARAELLADLLQKAARLSGSLNRIVGERRLRLQRAERGLPDLPALAGAARQRLEDRAIRLQLALPGLITASRTKLTDRALRLRLALPNVVTARRARVTLEGERLRSALRHAISSRAAAAARVLPRLAGSLDRILSERRLRLQRAERGLPDLPALASAARQQLEERTLRLRLALPTVVAARRARVTLEGERLRSALRHTTALRAAAGARVLPRLTEAPVQAKLRESRARLEGLAARLDSISHKAVLARGYAMVFDGKGQPLTTAANVKPGSALRIEFADGPVRATAAGGPTRQGALPL